MRRLLQEFFTPLVLLGGMLLACLAFSGLLAGLVFLRPQPAPLALGTAALNVIPAPTATRLLPTLPPSPTPSPTPPLPGLAPLAVNDYVQVAGTGADGLRLRADPGLNGNVLYLAIDAEVFKIIDGPRDVDGYTWWYLLEPYKQNIKGWAVANYLALIQNP